MAVITVMTGAAIRIYSQDALAWLGTTQQRAAIDMTAGVLGISAGAIAGAMVEEYDAYLEKSPQQGMLDLIAARSYSTHAQRAADYAAMASTADDVHGLADKLLHPVLIDVGNANIKVATAIRLVEKYAST